MVFNVDHCFGIKGQGTIMTGTVLQGSVKVGDSVEISALKESRKVKSMQMFKKPVQSAKQGDRIGMHHTLVSGFCFDDLSLTTFYKQIRFVNRIR